MADRDLSVEAPDICRPDDLTNPLARDVAGLVARGGHPYVRLVECRRGIGLEVVVVDMEVEVPQRRAFSIERIEPIAIAFSTGVGSDSVMPEVLALRRDFPRNTPHTNLRETDYPRSLCLYEVSFRDLRAGWTSARFLGRIRDWLRLTARGELHGEDQPLEPLLGDRLATVILPDSLRMDAAAVGDLATGQLAASPVPLFFERRPSHHNEPVLYAKTPAQGIATDLGIPVVAAVFATGPRTQSAIRRAPQSLEDLHQMLALGGDDLLGVLRDTLVAWGREERLDGFRLAIVLLVPKQRVAGGEVETFDTWAFLTLQTLTDCKVAMGVAARHSGHLVPLLDHDKSQNGSDINLGLMNVHYTHTRRLAAVLNGRLSADDRRIVGIGAGSLGSQVIFNATRAAFGRWTIIDDDLLLPHNLARHALDPPCVGFSKAAGVACFANGLTTDEAAHTSMTVDVLAPGAAGDATRAALEGAQLIVDMSASVTVARELALESPGAARRVSLFLNPTGTDLTLLAESPDRALRLDHLEMQYYRALLHRPELQGALKTPASRVRYGRSCRDISVELPQALAAIHAGIGARALERVADSPGPAILVWRVEDATLEVRAMEIPPARVHSILLSGWTVTLDDDFLMNVAELRLSKLPNETGGVLIGSIDVARKMIYIVDTIPSPPDSKEWPTLYIRGCVGLEQREAEIREATAGQLHYLGEWHSHPAGHSCRPSGDDVTVFGWLTERMDDNGLPALMAIVGDDGLFVPYLGKMIRGQAHPAEIKLK